MSRLLSGRMLNARLLNASLRPITAAVLVATTFANIPSLHAEAMLEEVIVTAQLRAEKLQDVPASIVTLSGDKMFEAGINDLADFQAYVPNLAMSETGIGTNLYVRGIGSGINQGFEQSVGMYVDGVYYGRAQLTRAPLMDLQRVEALRGPQNILLGKNSIAGAISLITAKPTSTPDSMVSASYTPETEERLYDVVLSGPLNDKAAARLAYRKLDSDGDMDNLTLDRDEKNRDEDTIRAILTFDVTENFDYMLKYEHSSFDITGRSIEIVNDDPSTSRLPGITGRTWGEILANTNITIPKGAVGGGLPTNNASLALNAGPSVLNNALDHRRSSNGDTSDNTTDNATFIGNYAIDDSVVTFTTAWLSYHYDEDCDCDFTGSNIFTLESKEKYDQFSQEIRFLSPVDKELEYITGVYYQTSDLKFNDDFVVPPGSALPALVNYAAKFNGTAVDDNSGFALANISVPRSYSQDSDLYSVFGEVTWNIQTDFRAIFGGRYSYEKKDATRDMSGIEGNGIVPVQVTQAVLSKLFKVDTADHDLKGDRSKGNFSPEVKVEYDINDDMLTYAKATEGYKSGGYDSRSNAIPGGTNDGSFEFDDEKATAYEVGMKNSLFDDELELNIAYFYTEYDDLQVSIYDGKLGFNVGNAAQAVTQGAEIESRWQATEQLSFSGSLAYLDFEYKDFQNGQCPQGVTADPTTGYCSYDGKSNQYVAPWTAAVLGQYIQPLFDGLELKFNLDLLYSDDYNPTQNLDSRVEQEAYTKVNARIGLSGNEGQWDIALVGKNLTNEEIITYANDTPLSYNLVQSVGHYAVVEDLRTIAITATYHF